MGSDSEELISIIDCESGFNSNAKNSQSSASGLGQWLTSSWIRYRKLMGRDTNPELRFNWIENIETMIFTFNREKNWGNWLASINCHGYN